MGPNWRPVVPQNLMKKSPGGLEIAPPRPAETQAASSPGEAESDEAAETAGGADPTPNPPQPGLAGLMNAEEIARLYQDAQEAAADQA